MSKMEDIAPFGLRMQPDLKAKVMKDAKANGRSTNAEIVARLERSGEDQRAKFAGHALQGLLASGQFTHNDSWNQIVTRMARSIADSMVEELSENQP